MLRPPLESYLAATIGVMQQRVGRTYGARRVWHDMLAEGVSCGLHRIERLMRRQALKARPRRRRLPPDLGERQVAAVAPNVLNRSFEAPAPNRKWIADFTYVWTAEGWLYVAAVIDLFSRRAVGWSMSAEMTAQLVTDALVMAIWRRCHRQWETDPPGTLNLTHRIRWFLREGGADAEGGGADGIGGFEEARGEHPGSVAVYGTISQHGSAVFARWRCGGQA